MLEQIENPVCTVVLVSPYFEMKGNIFLTSLPSSIHEQKFELWQLINLYRIVDGFAQNRIYKLDASQARSLIILSKILQGYWSTVHVNRDYSLLTLIQKHNRSLKARKYHSCDVTSTVQFYTRFFCCYAYRSRIATPKTFLNPLLREHTKLFIGRLFP